LSKLLIKLFICIYLNFVNKYDKNYQKYLFNFLSKLMINNKTSGLALKVENDVYFKK